MTHIEERWAEQQEREMDLESNRLKQEDANLKSNLKIKLDKFLNKTDIARTKKEEKEVLEIAHNLLKNNIQSSGSIEREFSHSSNLLNQWKNGKNNEIKNIKIKISSSFFSSFFKDKLLPNQYGALESKFNKYLDSTNFEFKKSDEWFAIQIIKDILKCEFETESEILKEYNKKLEILKLNKDKRLNSFEKVKDKISKHKKFGKFFDEITSK